MGIIKQMQLEEAEREYSERLKELKREADEIDPDGDWDPEDYEAYRWAMEKDD